MSIEITHDIEVIAEAVEVTNTLSGDTVTSNDHCIGIEIPDNVITGKKHEYSIVGDALYASVSADEAPTWLVTLVDSIVANSIAAGFVDYDNLVADVRSAIDSIDIASNNYVTQVNFDISQAGIVGSVVSQLDATYGLTGIQSTITNMDTVIANRLISLGMTVEDIATSYEGYTDGRITAINTSLSSAIGSATSSINALTSAYEDPTSGLLATASAVENLYTYVGLDGSGDPNSLGIIADLAILKKQNDGSVDVYAGTHDVITGTDTGTVDDDSMALTEWPYALWVPMSGVIDPIATTRTVLKGGIGTSLPIESNTVYHNTVLDTYWLFDATLGTWSAINLTEYNNYATTVRDLHKGDSYIKYSTDASGVKTYLSAFKFILAAIDGTSPYSTDTEGYTWAKVVDNDAQAAYIAALNAYSLADGKVSVYFALEAAVNPGTTTYSYYYDPIPIDGTNLKRTSNDSVVTPEEGDQVTVKVVDGTAEDMYFYFFKDGVWAVGTPDGIVANARWVINLDAYLGGNDGSGSWGGSSTLTNTVETTSKGVIKTAFEYDTLLFKDGFYYESGFGLDTSAGQSGAGSEASPFTSEFWIDAERFVLRSPTYNLSAVFSVTPSGIVLGLENTEATRNEPRGEWGILEEYIRGDIVTSGGSSYIALLDSTGIVVTDTLYWGLLAAEGPPGDPGLPGGPGPTGSRGTAVFTADYDDIRFNVAVTALSDPQVAALWGEVTSAAYATEIVGDTLIVTNTSTSSNGGTHIYEYTGSVWTAANTFTVNGNQVVTGTLSAAAIGTGSLVSTATTVGGQPLFSIDMNGGAVFRGIEIRDASNNLLMASGSAMDYSTIGGTKPPSNATYGATLGVGGNITGQITSATVGTYIASAAIGTLYVGDEAITAARVLSVAPSPYGYNGSMSSPYTAYNWVLTVPHSTTYLINCYIDAPGTYHTDQAFGIYADMRIGGSLVAGRSVNGGAAESFSGFWVEKYLAAGSHTMQVNTGVYCNVNGSGVRGVAGIKIFVFGAAR